MRRPRILPGEGSSETGKGGSPACFIDNAVDALQSMIPPPSEEERTEAIRRAVRACVASGLTEVHDMGVDSGGVAIYRSLIDRGQFPFRVYVALRGSSSGSWARFRNSGPLKEDSRGEADRPGGEILR